MIKKSKDNKKTIYTGVSSYYGPKFHGNLTANGKKVYLDWIPKQSLTKKHPILPIEWPNANNGAVFLLHPWRVGRKNNGALGMFLDKVNYHCV